MSDMFHMCMLLVKGCQALVMDPTSLLQQSLESTVPHCNRWCTDIESCKGENFRIWQKSGHIFGNKSLLSDMFLVCMLLVKGWLTLVMDPTSLLHQSLVTTVPYCNMVNWYIESCKGGNFRIWQKSGHIFGNTSLLSDMFLVCMLLL